MVYVNSHIMIVPEVHPQDYVSIHAHDAGAMNAAIQQFCSDIMMIWGSRKSQLGSVPIPIGIKDGVLDETQIRDQLRQKLEQSFVPKHGARWAPALSSTSGGNWKLSTGPRVDGRYYLDESVPPHLPQYRYCRSYFKIEHSAPAGAPRWGLGEIDPLGPTSLLKKVTVGSSSVRIRLLATLEHDFF